MLYCGGSAQTVTVAPGLSTVLTGWQLVPAKAWQSAFVVQPGKHVLVLSPSTMQ
jgi:hypothetical protein